MFKNLLVLFALFLFSINSFSQNLDKEVRQGLNYAYSFKWEKAEEVFINLIDKYPDNPTGYHYLSGIYLWYYLGSKNTENLKQFEKYSDLSLKRGSEMLKKKNNGTAIKYIIGANYNYRAITFAKAGNYLDAAWASNKAESYLDDVIKEDPKLYDAYLGLGLYNLAVSQIPSGFSWALKIAGISGDRETGIKYIKMAADKGEVSRVEAKYYLSQILSEILFDYKNASAHLKTLTIQYPDNILFNYAYAVVELKKRNLNESEKVLQKIVKKEDPKFKQVIAFSRFLLGDIYFRKNNFEEAAGFYYEFLNTAPDNDYSGIASYRLGLCYEILGNRKEAENYFFFTSGGNMDIEDDIYARRKGTVFHKRELTEEEINLVKFSNLVEAGKYKAGLDSLILLVDTSMNENIKSEAYIYLSEAAYKLGDFSMSLDYALTSNNLSHGEEFWIKPYAHYYAARAHRKLGNIEALEVHLNEAEEFNNYDYQTRLKNLLNVFRQQAKLNP